MTSFFSQVIDFLKVVVGLVINLLSALVTLFTEIPRWLSFSTVLVGYLPSALLSFAILAISLSVLFLLLGRS